MARVASVRPTNFTLEWIRELTLHYTTPDIHCRHRRHECDGGIRVNNKIALSRKRERKGKRWPKRKRCHVEMNWNIWMKPHACLYTLQSEVLGMCEVSWITIIIIAFASAVNTVQLPVIAIRRHHHCWLLSACSLPRCSLCTHLGFARFIFGEWRCLHLLHHYSSVRLVRRGFWDVIYAYSSSTSHRQETSCCL